MKVYLNIYGKSRATYDNILNAGDYCPHWYPGDVFFPTREAADKAAFHPERSSGRGPRIGCVELDADKLVVNALIREHA